MIRRQPSGRHQVRELGGETEYEIRVLNQGTKAASGLQVGVRLPPDMRAVDAKGPTRHTLDVGQVVFAPLAHLAPKDDTTYRVAARVKDFGVSQTAAFELMAVPSVSLTV